MTISVIFIILGSVAIGRVRFLSSSISSFSICDCFVYEFVCLFVCVFEPSSLHASQVISEGGNLADIFDLYNPIGYHKSTASSRRENEDEQTLRRTLLSLILSERTLKKRQAGHRFISGV